VEPRGAGTRPSRHALIPRVDLDYAFATTPPAADDVALLHDLLARRHALVISPVVEPGAPRLRVVGELDNRARHGEADGDDGPVTEAAPDEFPNDADEARAIVLLAFGETIMRFQILELDSWRCA
jgi:hypothetical protein